MEVSQLCLPFKQGLENDVGGGNVAKTQQQQAHTLSLL